METEAALFGLPANVRRRVHLEMGLGNIGKHLLSMAQGEQVDVVVLGTHLHRGPLVRGSVSHQVFSFAPMSVACVPGRMVLPGLSAKAAARA
jgi:nucleotide-binding universal stress UspA family protein